MEDVKFHGGHAVEIAADNVEGHEVTGYVEHQSAPRESEDGRRWWRLCATQPSGVFSMSW